MEKLGAAPGVKPILPPLVSEPSKHDSGSLLNLNPPRMRGLCITCVRDAAPLSLWDHYHLGQYQYRY
jgi:hypothetical protein